MISSVMSIKEMLNRREVSIITKRLQGLTFEEIGQEHGVTRERIRQIEAKAVVRIRKEIIRDFVNDLSIKYK